MALWMEMRLMWIAVAAVYPRKDVPTDRDAIVDQTVLVVSVNQILVKVSIITVNTLRM